MAWRQRKAERNFKHRLRQNIARQYALMRRGRAEALRELE